MTKKDLKNKTCWVTGASSGIGASLAVELSQLGTNLILSARNHESLEQVKSLCSDPKRVKILVCDLEKINTLHDITMRAWDLFDGIDFAFLNAGFAVRDMVTEIHLDLFERIMKVNYLSSVAISKSLLPLMINRGSGTFVITSSLSGKYGVPKLSAYSASKHALHGYFESLRAEYADAGIKVTMVVPGLVKTNISINSITGDGRVYGKMQKAIQNGIQPEKCARSVIKATYKRKNEAYIGGSEIYSVYINRFFPNFFTWFIRSHPLRKLKKLGLRS